MPANNIEGPFAAWVEMGGLEAMRTDERDRNYAGGMPQRSHHATTATNEIGKRAIFGIPYDGTETKPSIISVQRPNDPLEFGI